MLLVESISDILGEETRACFRNIIPPCFVCGYFHLYWMNKVTHKNILFFNLLVRIKMSGLSGGSVTAYKVGFGVKKVVKEGNRGENIQNQTS